MFQHLILNCVNKLRGERTTSGIYHLLTGKRSSQTMQDAKGYHLDHFFGVYPHLLRDQLDQHVEEMTLEGYISFDNPSFPLLTRKGEEKLSFYQGPPMHHFSGLVWHDVLPDFMRRLTLLIQIVTNQSAKIDFYLPIVDDPRTQRWVKTVYSKFHSKLPELTDSLYHEIFGLLTEASSIEAELFSHRLTGGGVIGMTIDQLKEDYQLTTEDVSLLLQHTYYAFFLQAKKDKERYPVLHLCTRGLEASHLITQSARRTYQYIQQGLSLDEIVTLRNLKKSTIQDHIVEAALIIPGFTIHPFLDEKEVEEINRAAATLNTQRLKQIHDSFGGKYNYFELRLALASGQHGGKEGLAPYED